MTLLHKMLSLWAAAALGQVQRRAISAQTTQAPPRPTSYCLQETGSASYCSPQPGAANYHCMHAFKLAADDSSTITGCTAQSVASLVLKTDERRPRDHRAGERRSVLLITVDDLRPQLAACETVETAFSNCLNA